jgi:hypothetical protein
MTWLAVASQSTVSSTEITRVNQNEAVSAAQHGTPSGGQVDRDRAARRNQPVHGGRRRSGPHPVIAVGNAPERGGGLVGFAGHRAAQAGRIESRVAKAMTLAR